MAYTTKRRITTNLLHAAFVLLFLRGNIPSYYVDRSNRFNLNSSSSEHILGSSWGYSQINFHRSNSIGSVYVHPKAVDSFEDQFSSYYDQNDILDVIRSPSIQSFRTNIPSISKVPAFQHNVTAYLVSNTSVSVSNQFPSIPAQVQPPVLLSVNVDVPSRSDNIESNLNESPSLFNTIERHDDDEEHSFHLISGNIVLLPETDQGENSQQQQQQGLLDPVHGSSDDLARDEAETEESSRLVVPEATDIHKEESRESGEFSGSPWIQPEIPIWDELRHGLDEDFSLGLAFDEGRMAMEMLELEDQPLYSAYSDEDEHILRAIPPMALHMPSTIEQNDENLNESASFLENQVASSSSSSSNNVEATTSVWNDDEMERVALDSIIDELWETDSGIFDALLTEDTEELEKLTGDTDDIHSEDSPVRLVQTEEDNSNLSGGFGTESSNEEEISSINESDMIQTASIYSNARPTAHPVQPRGFQVHGRMQGLLRGSSMDQRWQELANLLSLPHQPQHDPSGGASLPPLPHHHFPPHHHHHHHHLHHPSSSLHHHSMHHPPFSTAGPPAVSYNPDTGRSVLLQNATLPGPPPELNATSSYPNMTMGPPPNLGSALASSMHLTNSSGDPMIDPSSHYKMVEPSHHHHDMLYYPNMTSNASEMNNQSSTEGFLSSILNDDDLQLMDMAMNEGLYTMRMMDNSSGGVGSVVGPGQQGPGAGLPPALSHAAACSIGAGGVINSAAAATVQEDRMEASSDSAVSMGSERVSTMTDPHNVSDNEWTDEGHPHTSHDSAYSSDYTSKLRGYEYYGKGEGMHRVAAPVAQKKHQMFGKRVQQEPPNVHPYPLSSHPPSGLCIPYTSSPGAHQSTNNGSTDSLEMKYSCSVDFGRNDNDGRVVGTDGPSEIHSNHSYSLPQSHLPASTLSLRDNRQRPPAKEKPKKEYLSRDEKRARSMGLPISTEDIINLPMDEFNERLSKYDLSESQLSLIRDIRRRGKNKVAAQNCRKRKLDQILQLADEVQKIRDRKYALLKDQESLLGRRNNLKEKYAQLYRTVFQALRDRDGNPYSPNAYSLQQAADGNIILVPKNYPSTSGASDSMDPNLRRGKPNKDEIKKDG